MRMQVLSVSSILFLEQRKPEQGGAASNRDLLFDYEHHSQHPGEFACLGTITINSMSRPFRQGRTKMVRIDWAGMAELADAADSKSAEVHPSWGFNSPSRHQLKE
jgi:hypothetical protein